MELFLGIDVGTSGARVVAVTSEGRVVAESSQPLVSIRAAGLHEQEPEGWWIAVCAAIRALNVKPEAIHSVAVTSTSGSLVVTDEAGHPLRNAILYDDARAAAALEPFREGGCDDVNASWSLAKAVWVRGFESQVWRRAGHLLHPADWLAGRLTAVWNRSDYSNCLKMGYDPVSRHWGRAMQLAEIDPLLLPEVLTPGATRGTVCSSASAGTGIPEGVRVAVGTTDGIAGMLASGASRPGDANTTLGTTLVWKVLSQFRAGTSHGIYSHVHPTGYWAPGAASNSGLGCVECDGDPETLDAEAEAHLPNSTICYPLSACGERFPFTNSTATRFRSGKTSSAADWHAAQLQALAFLERWGYEVIEEAGVPVTGRVFSTGGAAGSLVFSRLRASILERPVCRAETSSSAFGAAMLAASEFHGGVATALDRMVQIAEVIDPDASRAAEWHELYDCFRQACAGRGYR
ncbi:MAG: FGGY-family carbohydrate kinase [Acidobacteria bacterium]|nr:FGGY-family carbohydrate kinase [Acidobacteriota bacterium]